MELYLFRPADFQLHYNCSFYSVEAVPLAARRHPVLGSGLIALFLFFESLYLPCVVVLWRHRHQSSCYKFMLYISVLDATCLPMNALLTGIFAFQGAVYCTYPTLMFFTGICGWVAWLAESPTAVLLALNRCVELTSAHWASVLYDGNRVWWWLALPTCYAIFMVFFTMPVTFSSVMVAWFFNPHVGYFEDTNGTYTSIHGAAHNLSIAIIMPTVYVVFALILLRKSRAVTSGTTQHQETVTAQRAAFGQVALISTLNAIGASVYTFMQFFPQLTPPALVIFATYGWVLVHGSPAVIYLTLNQTIRREALRMASDMLGCVGLAPAGITAQVGPLNNTTANNDKRLGIKPTLGTTMQSTIQTPI